MNPERWRQIEGLYHAALEREPGARQSFLEKACGDVDLRHEVESLLAQDSATFGVLHDSTVTQLAAGAQLGPYTIEAPIGAGGMGQVFKARDTRLGRSVAIKVVTEEFSNRFEREARAISGLNHPHICTLYDIGPGYLVMELVEGETLAARLQRGHVPMDDVLRHGGEIADALAAAHVSGIIHRDLKPANLMVTKSGIKVLDFGLARIVQPDETLTASHVIQGTPAYMAPEQREGKRCDARTDIYSLGLVLYEMATGKRLKQGETAILDNFPERFAHVIERCLESEPEDRWQSVRDVKAELGWVQESQPSQLQRGRFRWITAMAAVAFVAGVGWWQFWRTPRPENRPMVRFNVELGSVGVSGLVWDRSGGVQAILSPDGSRIVFVTRDSDGQQRLATRLLDQANISVLPATENAVDPFFSPNSQWLGFFAEGRLKKISIQGGAPIVLGEGFSNDRGASWGEDGSIVLSPNPVSDLLRLPAAGGAPQQLKGTSLCHWPQILPGGRAVLVTRDTGSGTANVEVLSLSTGLTSIVARSRAGGSRTVSATNSAQQSQFLSGWRASHRVDHQRGLGRLHLRPVLRDCQIRRLTLAASHRQEISYRYNGQRGGAAE